MSDAPFISHNGRFLNLPSGFRIAIESIISYGPDAIYYTEPLTGKNLTLLFDPVCNTGIIAKQLLDELKQPSKPELSPKEAVEPELNEQTIKTLSRISDVLFEKDKSILIELLSEDAHFLRIWREIQKHNLLHKELWCTFNEKTKELTACGKLSAMKKTEEKPTVTVGPVCPASNSSLSLSAALAKVLADHLAQEAARNQD
jgi:hypothetical protein|nr:MAG TPA: glycerophosphodiester phosphodiesterase [Caudoviricetes sp.]